MKRFFSVLIILAMGISIAVAQPKIKLESKPSEKKVDVLIGSKLFTSYFYPESVAKPVLWPVISDGGNEITRQYPFKNKAGERVDHPHHVGVWLNYGDVNGLDFWNNSEAIPPERADKYGTIYHETIESMAGGKGKATLKTTASWKDNKGNKLLDETSKYTFTVDGTTRIIDRKTMLRATNGKVDITDNKEGMFAIRVTRELELPSKGKQKLVDSHGVVTEVDASDDKTANANYLSSEGIEGGDVWATRAKWMKLYGEINGEKVAIVIFDHPANAGYPTYWHARGYGLFSANTLGQNVFSKGKEVMNLSLDKGEAVMFNYRLAVFSGEPTVAEIEAISKEFESQL